jgi:hypothetical protein
VKSNLFHYTLHPTPYSLLFIFASSF